MSLRRILALSFLAALVFRTGASAIVLDWDSITWANGSLNNSYDIDPGNAGNDVTIGITASSGSPFQPEINPPNQQTPAVTQAFQGGLSTIENTLSIALDLSSNSQSVTITISFAAGYTQGVQNVSFKIFDVDYANAMGNTYQDQLTNIRALSIDGTTLIAPTITTSANNSLSGLGINQVVTGTASTADTGATSGDGNVTISFGTNAIRSFTFTYGSGSAFADPTFQHIGIYDVNFTPVPEINPAWAVATCTFITGGLALRRRARSRG